MRLHHCFLFLVLALQLGPIVSSALAQTLNPRRSLEASGFRDQDDMCFWLHPTNPALSTVIASDKGARKLFVYDLSGAALQTIDVVGGEPNNIDIRYNFNFQGVATDIVGVGNRSTRKLLIYRVNPSSRTLERIDNDAINTASSPYGFALYVSPVSGKYYAFSPTESGLVEQFELTVAAGRIAGTRVRSWDLGGITEGTVCDDENGYVFLGEEDVGIWRVGAEPGDPTTATSVARMGDASGLNADVEGLTIYYMAGGGGYLLASSQGNNSFKVYERRAPHRFLRSFTVSGVQQTDGIDLISVPLNSMFPSGVFACHTHIPNESKPVKLCGFEDIGLPLDTQYWNPRRTPPPSGPPVISSFAPASGPVGTEVVLIGTRFTGTTAVSFNSRAATYNVDSDTRIRAVVPSGASTGRIRVTNSQGTATSAADFTVATAVPPSISSMTPTSGPVGTVVTVNGGGLQATSAVTFNGISASFTVVSNTQLRATVPSGATTGRVRVTNPSGTATSSADFTVTSSPVTEVILAPTHDSRVISSSPTTTYGSGDVLRVRSPTADPVYRSYFKFVVAGLTGGVTRAALRVHCNDGSTDGGQIRLVSNNYQGTSTPWVESGLHWNNAPALTASVLDQLGATEEGEWYEFDVSAAITGNGTFSFGLISGSANIAGFDSKEGTNPPELILQLGSSGPQPPIISSFTPASGPVGTQVVFTGTGFGTANAVAFNGRAATFVIESDTRLRATVPSGATTGLVRITSPAGSVNTASNFTVTTIPPSTVTFTPVHDSRVISSEPTTTYGTGPLLRVRSATADPAYRSYLKFNVSGIGASVTRAVVRLYCDDESVDGGRIHFVSNNYQGTSTPWVEASLHWNNSPALTGSPLDQRGTVGAGAWHEFDVTTAITGNGTFSFGLISGSTNIAGYSSKEGAHPPQLVISTTGSSAVLSASAVETAIGPPMALGAPHPNPFTQQTRARLELTAPARVAARVFDLSGRTVRDLGELDLGAGVHELTWDGRDADSRPAPSGNYWLKVDVSGMTATKRLTLAR